LNEQLKKIKLLLMDCDGVLTDGRLYFSKDGEAMKVFDVRDGQGIVSWHKAGFQSGIISGRGADAIVQARADDLGIKYVRTRSKDKVSEMREIASDARLSFDEIAFVGDDIGDIEVMRSVGISFSVADAIEEVKAIAAYKTKAKGGRGAVREVIDLLLNTKLDGG
jgi:YrbI family 3-deoxy-D-manno-octulosonate 8-phosphate phosphatase